MPRPTTARLACALALAAALPCASALASPPRRLLCPSLVSRARPIGRPRTLAAAADDAPPPPAAPLAPPPPPGLTKEVLAGMTVALASIPSSVAFAAIAGVSPLVGVWSSVVLGLAAPLLGSRPGVISGAAGVVAVPLGPLVAAQGPAVITLVTLLAAIIEALFGLLKLGKLVNLVSPTVMSGFLNGLGALLIQSQLKVFGAAAPSAAAAMGVAAATAALVQLVPRVTSAVPPSLAALVLTTAGARALSLPLATLSSSAAEGTFAGGLAVLPSLAPLPDLSVTAVTAVGGVALSIALISVLETLLAAKVLDSRGGASGGDDAAAQGGGAADRNCLAMAGGNLASALLGGFGGCGLIPQTVLNAQSGGRGRLSALAYALSMGGFVVAAAPLVGAVPVAALAGIMMTVGATTIQWAPTRAALADARTSRTHVPGLAALALATVVCFKVDMAAGIVLGIVAEKVLGRLLGKPPHGAAAAA